MQTLNHQISLWLRSWLGRLLMGWALDLMPDDEPALVGARMGLEEWRRYMRYEAYTVALGGTPFPFLTWRRVTDTFKLRSEKGCRYLPETEADVRRAVEGAKPTGAHRRGVRMGQPGRRAPKWETVR